MQLEEIVRQYLRKHGYTGLCRPDRECGCTIEDFMPCGEPSQHCEAGHRRNEPPGSEYDYLIYPGKAISKIDDTITAGKGDQTQ